MNFYNLRAFQAPLKKRIAFKEFLKSLMSSMNPDPYNCGTCVSGETKSEI